jgi:hypothetical protein
MWMFTLSKWSAQNEQYDFDPGQLATLKVQFIAQFRELLFFQQKLLAGDKPFFLRDHLTVFDSVNGFDFRHKVLFYRCMSRCPPLVHAAA